MSTVTDTSNAFLSTVRTLAVLPERARNAQVLTSNDPLVHLAGALIDVVLEAVPPQVVEVETDCQQNHCTCDTAHHWGCDLH